jgi:hypothetical protein
MYEINNMDNQALSLETDMRNYNRVKDLVLGQLVTEGYISEDEANEFAERCQVLLYKGNWFSRWFDKNMKDSKKDNYYIRIVELKNKQTSLDDLIRTPENS